MKDVEEALSSANTVWPKGKIQSQQALIPIQVTGETINPELLKQIKISNAEGKTVALSSVADVSEGVVNLKTISRTDGKPSVLIDVLKTPSSNVTDNHHFSLMSAVEGENQGSNIGNKRGISVTKNLLSSRSMGGCPPSL